MTAGETAGLVTAVVAAVTAVGGGVRWWLRRPTDRRAAEVDIATKTLGYAGNVIDRLTQAETRIAEMSGQIDSLRLEVDTLRRRQGVDEQIIASLRDYVHRMIRWLQAHGVEGYPEPPIDVT